MHLHMYNQAHITQLMLNQPYALCAFSWALNIMPNHNLNYDALFIVITALLLVHVSVSNGLLVPDIVPYIQIKMIELNPCSGCKVW